MNSEIEKYEYSQLGGFDDTNCDECGDYPCEPNCVKRSSVFQMKPLDIIIRCPNCGVQHIDKPETDRRCPPEFETATDVFEPSGEPYTDTCAGCGTSKSEHLEPWNNPPHKSHLCKPEDGGCGHKFRVADVPTNGVAEIKTRGENDTWPEVV